MSTKRNFALSPIAYPVNTMGKADDGAGVERESGKTGHSPHSSTAALVVEAPPATDREHNSRVRREFRRGILRISPLLIGVVPFGLVLGAQASQKGLSFVEVALMCGLNFAGGSEFVAIELWRHPPMLFLIAGMTFLVNSRHLLMGATLSPHLRNLSPRKALVALFFMADETWAFGLEDARARDDAQGRGQVSLPFYAGVAAGLYGTWLTVTTLGALIGPRVGNPETIGLDMAFPAVFLVIIKGLWKGYKAAIPWLISLASAMVLRLTVSGSWYVAGGTIAGLLTAYLLSGDKVSENKGHEAC
jgi:4-azaleucine resistance transporter AzlC